MNICSICETSGDTDDLIISWGSDASRVAHSQCYALIRESVSTALKLFESNATEQDEIDNFKVYDYVVQMMTLIRRYIKEQTKVSSLSHYVKIYSKDQLDHLFDLTSKVIVKNKTN